jgi:YD repeat-containing protein
MVRPGYAQTATIHYKNWGSDVIDAPLIFLTTSGATTTQIPPYCPTCSPKFNSLFTSLAGQEEFVGYKGAVPAGLLKPGDQFDISVSFTASPGVSFVNFNAYTVDDPSRPINWDSASMQPSWISSDAWAPIYANFRAQVGSTWGEYNHALASDVSYLSTLGRFEYRVSQLQVFELMKAGLDTISRRYRIGAFGRGSSHPFDIWGEPNGSGWLIHYPSGTTRPLVYQVVAKPGSGSSTEYVGGFGDDAIMVPEGSNQGFLLTEKSGVVYHLITDPNNGYHIILDYIQDLNGNKTAVSYTNGQVTGVTDSKGDTVTYAYNSQGRITQMIDPVGRITTYGYDSSGEHLLTITNPAGTTNSELRDRARSGAGTRRSVGHLSRWDTYLL